MPWLDLQAEIEEEFSARGVQPGCLGKDGFHLEHHTTNVKGAVASYSVTTAQRIFEHYTGGRSISKVAVTLSVSEDVVRRVLVKLGVEMRPAVKPVGPVCQCGKKGYARGMCRGCYMKARAAKETIDSYYEVPGDVIPSANR